MDIAKRSLDLIYQVMIELRHPFFVRSRVLLKIWPLLVLFAKDWLGRSDSRSTHESTLLPRSRLDRSHGFIMSGRLRNELITVILALVQLQRNQV